MEYLTYHFPTFFSFILSHMMKLCQRNKLVCSKHKNFVLLALIIIMLTAYVTK